MPRGMNDRSKTKNVFADDSMYQETDNVLVNLLSKIDLPNHCKDQFAAWWYSTLLSSSPSKYSSNNDLIKASDIVSKDAANKVNGNEVYNLYKQIIVETKKLDEKGVHFDPTRKSCRKMLFQKICKRANDDVIDTLLKLGVNPRDNNRLQGRIDNLLSQIQDIPMDSEVIDKLVELGVDPDTHDVMRRRLLELSVDRFSNDINNAKHAFMYIPGHDLHRTLHGQPLTINADNNKRENNGSGPNAKRVRPS